MNDLERVELAARRIAAKQTQYSHPTNHTIADAFREFADQVHELEKARREHESSEQ